MGAFADGKREAGWPVNESRGVRPRATRRDTVRRDMARSAIMGNFRRRPSVRLLSSGRRRPETVDRALGALGSDDKALFADRGRSDDRAAGFEAPRFLAVLD